MVNNGNKSSPGSRAPVQKCSGLFISWVIGLVCQVNYAKVVPSRVY